jgi:hypothetical protein
MPALQPIFIKAYWTLAAVGILWAVFILSLINPTLQRQYVRNFQKRTGRYADADTVLSMHTKYTAASGTM